MRRSSQLLATPAAVDDRIEQLAAENITGGRAAGTSTRQTRTRGDMTVSIVKTFRPQCEAA